MNARSVVIVLLSIGALVSGCDDSANDNPGVSGGMGGGMAGGDGGCVPTMGTSCPTRADLVLPTGAAILFLTAADASSADGGTRPQALQALNPATDTFVRVAFTDFKGSGTDGGGVPAGSPGSITVDAARKTVLFTLQSPPRLVVYKIENLPNQVTSVVGLGASGDTAGAVVVSADGGIAYAINTTQAKLFKVAVATGAILQTITVSEAPELISPSSLSITPEGRLVVGSSSATQTRMLVFEGAASLTYSNSLSKDLADGATRGTMPGPCAMVPGKPYLYCSSGDMGSTGGLLWMFEPGVPPMAAVSNLTTASAAVAVSPRGDWVFVADGATLRRYWIKDNPAAPPAVGTLQVGGPISGLTTSSDGSFVYATVPSTNQLLRVSTVDLSISKTFADLGGPGPIVLSPGKP